MLQIFRKFELKRLLERTALLGAATPAKSAPALAGSHD